MVLNVLLEPKARDFRNEVLGFEVLAAAAAILCTYEYIIFKMTGTHKKMLYGYYFWYMHMC